MEKRSRLLKNDSPRSGCPVANTLDLVGDKWTLLIIRDLLRGKSKYGEFASSSERIPTNILATRLKALEAGGVITRKLYCEKPKRYEYCLTAEGNRLGELVRMLKNWGTNNIKMKKNGE